MEGNTIKNPFAGCTARDMGYDEVEHFWCSPFSLYKLNEDDLFSNRTPFVIEGVRGTGKTMILKYLSYSVQKMNIKGSSVEDILDFFKNKSIGIYFRYKDDFCNMINYLDCDEQDKKRIFKQYYNLFISRQIIDIMCDIYKDTDDPDVDEIICKFWGIERCSITDLYNYVNELIEKMDDIINNSYFNTNWVQEIMSVVGRDNLIVDFISTINKKCNGWGDILFSILLDEYENLGNLQVIVNTLIKQVDETVNLTYRLGMRPEGMSNNITDVAGERLQIDRDFILKRLEFENTKEYKRFALGVSRRRLENVQEFKERNIVDIERILGKDEDFDKEAERAVDGKIKHFYLLKNSFSKDEIRDNIIKEIACDNKLMEMYNILRVSRGLDKNYKDTGDLCKKYIDTPNKSGLKEEDEILYKYYLDYSSKYRMALLFLLLKVYGKKKMYYSLNTFLKLSSGSINDFISLCRNVFKYVDESVIKKLENGGQISEAIQTNAALDTANDQMLKIAMSNKNGREMVTFVENLGNIFDEFHKDDRVRYPETNQFAFEDENEIRKSGLNKYLVDLINSGAIIKKSNRQRKSLGENMGYIYQLNRIFAPIFHFSYRTRGGVNVVISKDLFQDMLNKEVKPSVFIKNIDLNEDASIFDYSTEDDDE